MKIVPPIVDARSEAEVLQAFDARAPGYTPEWLRKLGTPDSALAQVFSRYTTIYLDGLRQTPGRGFLAFLDMVGTRLLTAEAARVPLVFELMENATTDPLLVADSQIAATLEPQPASALLGREAPGGNAEDVIFATDKMITLARARLTSLYSLDPGSDEFADHAPRLTIGFAFFDDMQPTEHAVYLGHDELYALASSAEIEAEVRLSVQLAPGGAASQSLDIEWEYLSEDGWLPLDLDKGNETKKSDDGTEGLTKDGQILLRKKCGPDAKEETIAGHTSYWIRGVLRTALMPEGTEALGAVPALETIRTRVSFVKAGLRPEAAANDGFALDVLTTFFPFGRQPVTFSTFYLASKEVFQRRGARVRIEFTVPFAPYHPGLGALSDEQTPAVSAKLAWEYFAGKSWRTLTEFGFHDGTEALKKTGVVAFLCPPDWAETSVAGKTNYWVRARIDSGDYGHPVEVTVIDNVVEAKQSTLKPPVIASATLQYSYQTDSETLDHCLAFNDFVFADHTHACIWPRELFEPFRPLEERLPAVHFGFDKRLPSGLVSLFVHVPPAAEQEEGAASEMPPFVWEYCAQHGWEELGVLDETLGLRRSGMIQFIGPKDAVAVSGLGGSLFRIRARLKVSERPTAAPIAGVWMNAVWATHRLFAKKQELGVSDGNPRQTFHFRSRTPNSGSAAPVGNPSERPNFFRQGTPVLEGETLEVREWVGRGADYETAIQGVPPVDVRYEHDRVSGVITEAWVRWHERPHLFTSGAADRHYVIERALGSVRFGDDAHGRIPSAGSRVVVSYGTGGGLSGNVAAGVISELRSAVPFLKSVANPIAALGGAEAETLQAVQRRGAQRFRHGDRAISASDIEWLTHDASPAVARARCLPVTGPIGRVQRGWISVVVLPHSTDAQPAPTSELKRQVHRHLIGRVPAAVANRVRIIPAAFVPVGAAADVVPRSPEEAARVEARLLLRLDRFLHPLTGGTDGHGWPFGQSLHLSQIATLLEQTEGVDYVLEIGLRVDGKLFGDSVPVGPDALIAAGDHELKLTLGEH